MKEKILEELRNKYSTLGPSKEMLDGYATWLASTITNEDGIAKAVADLEPIFKLSQKEADKMRAKYKKEAEQRESDDNSKKTDTPDVDNFNVMFKTFMEEFKTMKEDMATWKSKTKKDGRMADINEAIRDLPDSFKTAYRSHPIDNLSDEGFKALIDGIKDEVKKFKEAQKQDGAFYKPPFSKNGGGDAQDFEDKTIDEAVDNMFD